MSDFKHFFFQQVSEMISRSNDRFSCIEDQFYYIDKFPRYEQDDKKVFKCNDCGCLLQVDCLTECDLCEKNFCDFKHTDKTVCTDKHDCAKRNLVVSNYGYHYIRCKTCIQL